MKVRNDGEFERRERELLRVGTEPEGKNERQKEGEEKRVGDRNQFSRSSVLLEGEWSEKGQRTLVMQDQGNVVKVTAEGGLASSTKLFPPGDESMAGCWLSDRNDLS